MKTKSLTIAILATLLLSIFAVFPNAYAAPSISLDPSTTSYTTDTASIGTRFNITVSCLDVPDLGGAQIYMEFDDSIINCTQWWAPTWDPNFFYYPTAVTTLPAPPDPGYVHVSAGQGYVKVGVMNAFLPPKAPYGHNGTIAILEFEVTDIPGKYGELNCTLKINDANTYLLDDAGDEIAGVVKNDGFYEIIWATPTTNPEMGLNPLTKTFGPDPPSAIGQTYDQEVLIKDLAGAWALTSAQFNLTYNATVIDVIGGSANITIDTLWGASAVIFTAGNIRINVSSPTSTPSGTVLVATIKFTVMMQQDSPPAPPGTFDKSDLIFLDVSFYDTTASITPDTSEQGLVKVFALRTLELPWFEVVPTLVELGPEPSIGEEFTVDVKITGPPTPYLDESWNLIGLQFRLFYDDELIEAVSVSEGDFLQDTTWNLYGTFFVGSIESNGLGPHILAGGMLLPNGTGYYDQTTFPNGEGTVASITFKVIKQECPDPFECNLTLTGVFGEGAIDKDGCYIPMDDPVNGLYRILPFDMPGRVIDLYGGANNNGYWTGYPAPFPVPYGGQGQDHWMDIVFPQTEVTFYANVTYNYWPVQSKDIGFEIEGPYEKLENGTLVPMARWQIWAKFTATTDEDGIAVITYRMPWPCDDPDGITGVWVVTATGIVADIMIDDVIIFYYERLVYITKVTTDKFYYIHDENIQVTVEYKTHAVQEYPALFSIVLTDDLGVPFGIALHAVNVGGACFCFWKIDEFTESILIPKWAYAGYGDVHVTCYDKDPTDGGFAWCPEYTPPEFQIGPY